MDFSLSDEHEMIYGYGAKLASKFDSKYFLENARAHRFPKELWKQLGEDGFLGTIVKEEHGGSGLGMLEFLLLVEGLANHGLPLWMMVPGPAMVMHIISKLGNERQRALLPAACAGELNFCAMITESNAGTNTMRIATAARANGNNGWLIQGSKTFITGVDVSSYAMVVTRTTPIDRVARKTDGFTIFLVDLKKKGVTFHPLDISVVVPEQQFSVFFDDVEVGPADVIGEVDRGADVLFNQLDTERIACAGITAGLGRYAIGRGASYASERVVFNSPIGSHQAVQHPLAAAKVQVEMASLLARQAAWAYDQGVDLRRVGQLSNMAKYACAEASVQAVEAALMAHGGNGFTYEYGIYDYYSVARAFRTIPINRDAILSFVGQHVLGMPRSTH